MSKCPLGEDCDLTIAWMLGYEKAKDKYESVLRFYLNEEEFDKALNKTYNSPPK